MVLLITLAYMFPVVYLPRIIFGLLRKEFEVEGGIDHLKKIRSVSLSYLIANIVLWIPHAVAGTMYYGSTGTVEPEIEWIFMASLWTPAFSLLCTIISSIAVKFYSKKQ